MKRTPLTRKKPMRRTAMKRTAPKLGQRKPRNGLRQVSTRRQRELREYSERRKSFLSRPENRWCPVWAIIVINEPYSEGNPPKRKRTTDVHHKAGREGKLLNDETYWLAVSREGHEFIHTFPNAARTMGWLI